MKKVILAIDGSNFSEAAFEFARRLNELKPLLLTGVFLPQAELYNTWSYADGIGGLYIPLVESRQSELVKKSIDQFQKRCTANGIDYRVHEDYFDFAIPELKQESRYADLLIIGSEKFYENAGSHTPNQYLQNALHDVQCPVLLVPEKFEFPVEVTLTYDGTEDSVYAIKQFAYLFPELSNRETFLLYVSEDPESDFPDKIQMEELVSRHFKKLNLLKLEISPKKDLRKWFMEKKSTLLVSGSYGRSGLSQLFSRSFMKDLIADHRLPIFIAHK
jgi:nucleotide-binding universal stress UspA family protein